MSDGIIRALAYDGMVRVSAVICTEAVEEACRRHDTFPVATAALGRTMAGTLLLSWGLKGEGSITLRVFGQGPLGGIIVTANAAGEVKGYVQEPHVEIPLNGAGKLDVGAAVGFGDLYITKDIGMKEPYTGMVPLYSGEIGDDIANYLMVSEQTPSIVAVGVLVNPDYSVAAAGGIILQAMPDATAEVLADLEDVLKGACPVSALIAEGNDLQGMVAHYLPGKAVQYLEETPVQWRCKCDAARIRGLLKSVGVDELKDIIDKEGSSEVVCHFCNESYLFEKPALEALLKEMEQDLKESGHS